MLTASQIRAARAILNWSQQELANKADISLATIRKIELGYISPRLVTTDSIHRTLETAGIEFMDPDGARRRPGGVQIFEGRNGGKDFMEDLYQTAKKNGGNIHIVTPSAAAFAKYCGISDIRELDRLTSIGGSIEIKCLVIGDDEYPLSTPRFQIRSLSKNFVDPVPFCAYGAKYALAVPNGEPFSKLIVVESVRMAASARQHFESLWEKTTGTRTSVRNEAAKVA